MPENEESMTGFTVIEIQTGFILDLAIIGVRFRYLAHSMQPHDQARWSRWYALSKLQTGDLIKDLDQSIQTVSSAVSPPPETPRH